LTVLLVALVNRALLLFWFARNDIAPCLGLDPDYYYTSALEIAKGYLVSDYGMYCGGPFYPYFLGGLVALLGKNLLLLRIAQSLVGVATNVLLAQLGIRLFSRRAGLYAGLIYAFCGPLLFGELNLENEFLITFFTLAATLLFVCYRQSRLLLFLGGCLLGLATITRPNQLLAALLVLVCLYLLEPGLGPFLRKAVPVCCGIILMLAPITVRNYYLFHEFVPTSFSGGFVFYIGNNPSSAFAYKSLEFGDASFLGEFQSAWSEASRRAGRVLKPNEASSYWFGEGLKFMAAQPGKVLQNYLERVISVVNNYELPDNYNYYFYRQQIPMLKWLFVSFGMIFPFALIGLWRLRKREQLLVLVAPITSFVTIMVLSYNGRYRGTAYFALILLAGVGITYLAGLLKERRFKPLAWCGSAVLLAALVSYMASPYVYNDYYSLVMVGNCLAESKPALAMQRYNEAILLNPGDNLAFYNLAELYRKSGNNEAARMILEPRGDDPEALLRLADLAHENGRGEEAIGYLQQALVFKPNFFQAYELLGSIYKDRGEIDKAIASFRKALDLNPIFISAKLSLARLYQERGLTGEAGRELAEILKIQPFNAEAAKLLKSRGV
jgi:tetratricopeptide (TPR) repeat protein